MASIFQYCGETYQDRKIITVEDPISIAWEVETGLRRRRHSHRLGAILIPSTILSLSPGSVVLRKIMGVGELLNRLSFEAAVLAGKSGHFCLGTARQNGRRSHFPIIAELSAGNA